jgi:Leucine-rich repeat (LRR) protein
MKQSQLKQLIKEQILVEIESVPANRQIYGETIDGEIINFKLDEFNNLNCIGKNLKTLIVNDLRITQIYCGMNLLTTLRLGRLSNLKILSCTNNKLTNLDVSKCPNLEKLYCYTNQLKSLNVSNCPNLKELWCHDNQLTTLDIFRCPKLKDLYYDKDKTQLIK